MVHAAQHPWVGPDAEPEAVEPEHLAAACAAAGEARNAPVARLLEMPGLVAEAGRLLG